MKKLNLVIIGTGPAASRVVGKCGRAGWKVGIFDRLPYGGVCALRGCSPKKVFVKAAELRNWMVRMEETYSFDSVPQVNWQKLVAFKHRFTDPITPHAENAYEEMGLVHGVETASFQSPKSIKAGDEIYEAEHIVVATGSESRQLGIPGEEHLMHSEAFMDMDELPENILFIGAGYISMELSHFSARLGAKVKLIEALDRPLQNFDPDMVEKLVERGKEDGIDIDVNTKVKSIEKRGDHDYVVQAEKDGETVEYRANLLVHGAGRVPSVNSLDLEKGDVYYSEKEGIAVKPTLQSVSNPRVYAAGDVSATPTPPLTPVANYEGRIVAKNLLEDAEYEAEYGVVPTVAFTIPSIASVGLSEAKAREENRNIDVRQGDFSDQNTVRKIGENCAHYKIIIDKESDRILGAHLVGPNAHSDINLFTLAINQKATTHDYKANLFTFPTFGHDTRGMV
ncbi:MAG: dihydrolipoyl dehydrogenase family protein [Candidatus Sumerlaeia bacterium]